MTRPALLQMAACALGLLVATELAAQWAWKDANGRLVFSDQPPPASVKADQVVRQPGAPTRLRPLDDSATEPAKADAGKAAPKTMAEREAEFRKRQAERAEAEKKEADKLAADTRKQQDCERMRGYLRSLEDGVRISRTDAQGNREVLDDAARAAEVRRIRESMRECS